MGNRYSWNPTKTNQKNIVAISRKNVHNNLLTNTVKIYIETNILLDYNIDCTA